MLYWAVVFFVIAIIAAVLGFGGIAASADALALVMLGHEDVKLYDASLSEWAIDPSLPMEVD